jgi:2-C-methyl-D-erythritol 2,4-cyclodiphosphate synthase
MSDPAQLRAGDPPCRVGIGYDIHRLVSGRRLVLGGVEIPFQRGLEGHSDADVLTHAIMDALLGAAALGDIGHHFPPGDPRFKDISSLALLRKVAELLRSRGFAVGNVDATIVAEEPKMAPHVPEMRRLLAGALGVAMDQASVKATTNEGLGPLGAGAGIAAWATASIIPTRPAPAGGA